MTETLLSRGGRAMCALELPPYTPEEAWWQGIIPTAVQVLARRPVYEMASDTYWGDMVCAPFPSQPRGPPTAGATSEWEFQHARRSCAVSASPKPLRTPAPEP